MGKVTEDKFYSEENMQYLENVIAEIERGEAQLEEHELIEV